MGTNLSWIAFKGRAPEAIRSELGLKQTSREPSGYPGRGVFTGIDLKNGWYVILTKDPIHYSLPLAELSRDGGLVWTQVEDMMSYSASALWSGGEQVWHVEHHPEANEGDYAHLEISGTLTPELEAIREGICDKQKEEEYDLISDVPIELAGSITEFRHDDYDSELALEDLEATEGGLIDELEKQDARGCRNVVIAAVVFLILLIGGLVALLMS